MQNENIIQKNFFCVICHLLHNICHYFYIYPFPSPIAHTVHKVYEQK